MKNKKIIIMFAALLLIFYSGFAEDKLSLGGSWSFQFLNDNRKCRVRGGEVLNKTNESYRFKLVFVLSKEKKTKDSNYLFGVYVAGSNEYGYLESGWQYNDCYFESNDFKYSQPDNGWYYAYIVLLRKHDSGNWVLDDLVEFKNTIQFNNLIKEKAEQLRRELGYTRINENYYKQTAYNASVDNPYRNEYYKKYFDCSNRIRAIQRELTDLGFDSEGVQNIRGGRILGATAEIQTVPEYKPSSSSSSYTPAPSYTPNYSSPSSSSSSSGSGMHKETVFCTSCNGTGKDKLPKNTATYGSNSKPWCSICGKYDSPHYHDVCRMCNGRGTYEKWVNDK